MHQPGGNVSSQDLLSFLRKYQVAVLASIRDDNKAHAATIYYYVEDDFRFYFLTKNQTRKMDYMKNNKNVALVISDSEALETVQVEGEVNEVDYSEEYAPTVKKFTENLADSGVKWESMPLNHIKNSGYFAFMQISPTWIRWADYSDWDHTVKFQKKFD